MLYVLRIAFNLSSNCNLTYASALLISVNSQPNYLKVTSHRASNKGLLDLKPYFANSPKAKHTKNGGWYLIVPIRRKTRDMSYQLYQQAKNIDISNKSMATSPINSLYSNRQTSWIIN